MPPEWDVRRGAADFREPGRIGFLSALKLAAMIGLLVGVGFLVHFGWSLM